MSRGLGSPKPLNKRKNYELRNRKPNNRCKGAFDANMQIYERMGFKEYVK